MKSNPTDGDVPRGGGYSRNVVAGNLRVERIIKSNPTDRDVTRGGYSRYVVAGSSREFRVVRDNRTNKDVTGEVKPPSLQSSTSTSKQRSLQAYEKGSTVVSQKSSGGNYSPRHASAVQTVSHGVVPQVHGPKQNDPKPLSSLLASNHSVVGVYSSSSDPVHVPSPDSRSAANVGAIKRELGVVGVRRQASGNSVKPSNVQSNSISTSHLVKDRTSARGSSKSSTVTSTSDQPSKTSQPESVLSSKSGSRSSSSNQYNSRLHQQVAGHQKGSQPAKEWKRKSGPKSNNRGHGVIGSPTKSVSHFTDISEDLKMDAVHLHDKLSRADIYENENVFIAEHIRVSDSDSSRLTFGSFGTETDSSRTSPSESITVKAGENSPTGVSISLSTSIHESPTVETSASKHVDLVDDQVQNSGSNSPSSGGLSENLLPDKKGTSSPQNLDNYAGIGFVRGNSPLFAHIESQQHQDPAELSSFPVYNPQTGYDIPYFRPSMDEPVRGVRGQGLQSPPEDIVDDESLSIHVSVSSPPTPIEVPNGVEESHHSPSDTSHIESIEALTCTPQVSITSLGKATEEKIQIEIPLEAPIKGGQAVEVTCTVPIVSEASPILESDNFDSFLEEITMFEAFLQHTTSSSSSTSSVFPTDQFQAEILIQFYKLIEIPVNELIDNQLVELLEVSDKLESFRPLTLSLEKRTIPNSYSKEPKACFDDIRDYLTKISQAHVSIEEVSAIRSKMKENIETCKLLQSDLAATYSKENELRRQLEAAQGERMDLEQKLLSTSQATNNLKESIADGPATLATAHQNLLWHQDQLSHRIRIWKNFKAYFKSNPR